MGGRALLYERCGFAEAINTLKKAPNRIQLKYKNPRVRGLPGALSSGRFMRQASTDVWLSVVPATGHLVNLEEPDLFHRPAEDVFAQLEAECGSQGG